MEKEEEMNAERGMVHVYTGDGKGKTTAALGLAMRAIGHCFKVFMVQFLKNPDMMGEPYGEIKAQDKFQGALTIKSFGKAGWIRRGQTTEEDKELVRRAMEASKSAIHDPAYKLVILDEIFLAHYFELLSVNEIIELIDSKPIEKELVLTGRNAPQEVIERADLVTEMRCVKHYYEKGIKARKGVEF